MNKFVISTDSCVDELKTTLKNIKVEYMPMVYILDKEYRDNFDSQAEYDAFYEDMKKGALPTTSMLNTHEMEEYFEKLIKQYDCDILHISLSSGLSGTYDNTEKAAKTIMKKYPNNKIFVVDSLGATQGQNLLLNLAVKQRQAGEVIEVVFNNLNEAKLKLQHWVIINDLFHLKRGGRLSGTKAILGTMLQTKPILTMNNLGKLEMHSKAAGTKKAIRLLTDKLAEFNVENTRDNLVYIAHSHCLEEAQFLKDLVKKQFDKITIEIKNIGPVIGSHTGPGALGILFFKS
jgi:DegV family protein with EDD domain